jgi:hypothetical protein
MASAVAEFMEKFKTGKEEDQEKKLKKLISAILLNKGLTDLEKYKASKCSNRRLTITELGNRYQAYKERKASSFGIVTPNGSLTKVCYLLYIFTSFNIYYIVITW